MQDIAARNRAIKKTLERAFGRGKVRVRGSRGTGYGYVHAHIAFQPKNWAQERELNSLAISLLRAAGIDLGRAYTDDTCQHQTHMCHIQFETTREGLADAREMEKPHD